jgi:glycosyltransferase involved in cell wall biosynthesis
MKIAMLSPIAWRTPPRHYGPWESVVSNLTEGLVARGHEVTLFATGDSKTAGMLRAVCPKGYEEDNTIIPKVWECLHISEVFERADEFDLIHNNFDYLPLSYSRLVSTPVITTVHGFSSPGILPAFQKYDDTTDFVSISDSDRSPLLKYAATIYHGIDPKDFEYSPNHDDYLLFFGRFHPDKGAHEAIKIARSCKKKLILAGIVQDPVYFRQEVEPFLKFNDIIYVGSVGPVERNRLLGKALALLHPINFNEPFGLSVIEAMACGTPVIAYNRGSMPEIIEDGKNGYLCEGLDAAIQCVSQIAEIERSYCHHYVKKHFTVTKMVEKYIAVYEAILANRGRNR